jgi:hypothetical protein
MIPRKLPRGDVESRPASSPFVQAALFAAAMLAAFATQLGCSGSGYNGTPGPSTWTGLYNDYFGPSAEASCTGAACHASADEPGPTTSNFLCSDKETCYKSMTGNSNLVGPQDTANPSGALLLRAVRTAAGGRMPSSSSFVFVTEDTTRIEAWIAAGAKND